MLGSDCRLEVVDTLQPRESGLYTGLDEAGAWLCVLARGRGLRLRGMTGAQLRDMGRALVELGDELDEAEDSATESVDAQLAAIFPGGTA
jgi:hypothetical protein